METFPIFDKDKGFPFAFEIENAFISAVWACKVLSKIPSVTVVRANGFPMFEEIRAEFLFREKPYVISEPFGDNSRYWIGPKDPSLVHDDVTDLEQAFRSYRVTLFEWLIGNLLTLRSNRSLKKLFRSNKRPE